MSGRGILRAGCIACLALVVVGTSIPTSTPITPAGGAFSLRSLSCGGRFLRFLFPGRGFFRAVFHFGDRFPAAILPTTVAPAARPTRRYFVETGDLPFLDRLEFGRLLPAASVAGTLRFFDVHFERLGFLAPAVGLLDLGNRIHVQTDPVHRFEIIRIPIDALEYVHLLEMSHALLRAQDGIGRREAFQSIDINIQLEIQAALEFSALPGQFLRVERRRWVRAADVLTERKSVSHVVQHNSRPQEPMPPTRAAS